MVVSTQGWMQCPRGELARLSVRLKLRRLLKVVVAAAAIAVAIVVTATVIQVAANSPSSWFSFGQSGGGSCGTPPTNTVTPDDCHGGTN